jgi:hypothetical protein
VTTFATPGSRTSLSVAKPLLKVWFSDADSGGTTCAEAIQEEIHIHPSDNQKPAPAAPVMVKGRFK